MSTNKATKITKVKELKEDTKVLAGTSVFIIWFSFTLGKLIPVSTLLKKGYGDYKVEIVKLEEIPIPFMLVDQATLNKLKRIKLPKD